MLEKSFGFFRFILVQTNHEFGTWRNLVEQKEEEKKKRSASTFASRFRLLSLRRRRRRSSWTCSSSVCEREEKEGGEKASASTSRFHPLSCVRLLLLLALAVTVLSGLGLVLTGTSPTVDRYNRLDRSTKPCFGHCFFF